MKPPAQPRGVVRISVTNRLDMDVRLSEAVEALIIEALRLGDSGILVTRRSATDLTVQIHPDVPFGETHERQEW